MYVKKISIENVRTLNSVLWELSEQKSGGGWHVIIGDNGSGKSTFLRSIALALIGPNQAYSLRQDWNEWLTRGRDQGKIELTLSYDKKLDQFSEKGKTFKSVKKLQVALHFMKEEEIVKIRSESIEGGSAERHIWSEKSTHGWFSAGYGPFRRFTGKLDNTKLFFSNPKLASHLTLFDENVALTESLAWLQQLRFKQLENSQEGQLLDAIKMFINQGSNDEERLLPFQAKIENISSNGVDLVDGNGYILPIENFSDGYRSVLSMTFELIRQLSLKYSIPEIFNDLENPTIITAPGVVLIDEIDIHLHPTWQVKIGFWFRKHFPNIQFIVATHSPLICYAAIEGSVFCLPQQGQNEEAKMLEGVPLNRLIYGNILDAYGTQLFGENVTSSVESRQKRKRLAHLNFKETKGSLTEAESKEQQVLRSIFSSDPNTIN